MTRYYIVPVEDDERNLDTMFVGQIRSFPELIKCNDCKHKTKCYSDVVMIDKSRTADIYESVQWCSLGERETYNG